MEEFREKLEATGQEHLLKGWEELSTEEQQQLSKNIQVVDQEPETVSYFLNLWLFS